jgi:hypothetical protein
MLGNKELFNSRKKVIFAALLELGEPTAEIILWQ